MKTVLISIGNTYNVNFIGKPERYQILRKEVQEFNKNNNKEIHLDNFIDEIYYILEADFEKDVSDIVYTILIQYHKLFEIDAKMRSEIFKGIKIKHYL